MSLKNIFSKEGIQQRKTNKEIKAFKKLKGVYEKLDKKLIAGKISQSELNKHEKLLEELNKMAKKFTLENGSIKLVDPEAAKKQGNVTLNSEDKEQFLKSYKQKIQEQTAETNIPAPEDIEYMKRMQDLKEQEVAAQQRLKEAQIKKERLQELQQESVQQDAMKRHALQQQEAQHQEVQRQHALQQQEAQRRQQPQQAIESVEAQRQRVIQQQQAMQQQAMEYARQQEQQVPQQIPPLEPQTEQRDVNVKIVLEEGIEVPVHVGSQRIPEFVKAIEATMNTNSFFEVDDILINTSKILFLKLE